MSNESISVIPTIYNVALTTANTEYSQLLPNGCNKFAVSIQSGASPNTYRIAYVTGKVAIPTAPYLTYLDTFEYKEEGLCLVENKLFLASSAGSVVAQIIAWS